MAGKSDLLIRIQSQFSDQGFKSATASARAMERELKRVESSERSLAAMQIAAHREDEQRRAAQRQAIGEVGQAMMMVGAVAAVGLGLAAKAASDWESAWAGVTKTVDGSTEQMAALEGELRGLARTLPATHEEIAGVAEAAGQLGVKRQDIAAFTKTMIDLGNTTNLSADEAATGLAQLGNVMGVLPGQADRAGAALVALGNDGASTEADILEMSQRIAGAGRTIGLTEAQVMGFASALSSVGIEAEAGGSSISRVFVDIAQAADKGGAKLEGFAEVAGVSATQFAEMFRRDAAGAVTTFIEGLGRMQQSGQSTFAVLDRLGLSEIRVRDALLRTANAGDIVRKSVDLGSKAWQANSALVEEANKRYQTAESRIEIARNRLNDAAIDIGGVVLPALAGAAGQVGVLADAFSGLPDGVKTSVVVLGSVATAALLVGGAALAAVPKIAALRAALEGMGARGVAASGAIGKVGGILAGPWGVAMGAAVVGLGFFVNRMAEAKQRADSLGDSLDDQTGAVTENTKALIVNQLQQDGVLDAARELGLNLEDVTEAALGNAEAIGRVTQALEAAKKARLDAVSAAELGESMGFDATLKAIDDVRGAIDDTNGSLAEQRAKLQQQKEAAGQAAGETGKLAGEQKKAADETKAHKDELDKLAKALQEFGSAEFEARDAARGYADAVREATTAAAENGRTVSTNSEAGRKNQEALDGMAQAALKSAAANLKNGASTESVTGQVMKAQSQFVAMAQRMGMSRAAAEALAAKLGLTKGNVDRLGGAVKGLPNQKNIDINADTSNARRQIASLYSSFTRAITIQVDAVARVARSVAGKADGGVESFAAGGTFRTAQPGISWNRGDRGIQWAETGAGPWEGFVSGHPAKRGRSIQVWQDIGRRLGVLETARPTRGPIPATGADGRSVSFGDIIVRQSGAADPYATAHAVGDELSWRVAVAR